MFILGNKKIKILIFILLILLGGCQTKSEKIFSYQKVLSPEEERQLLKEEQKKLVKGPDGTIYYIKKSGQRLVFPDVGTYQSWFDDFAAIPSLSLAELYKYPLAGNVFYKPGRYLLRTPTDNNIYFVAPGGVLRPFKSHRLVKKIYGRPWAQWVREIENYYFTNYQIGDLIKNPDALPLLKNNITIESNQKN